MAARARGRVPTASIGCLLGMLWSAPGLSQTPAQAVKAADLLEQAVVLQQQDRHREALDVIEQAWAYYRHAKILYYKAISLIAVEEYQAAKTLLDEISGHPDLRKHQAKIESLVATLDDLLLPVVVTIQTEQSAGDRLEDAWVKIDGKRQGRTPYVAHLPPGVYTITAGLALFTEAKRVIRVAAKQDQVVTITLTPEVAKAYVVGAGLAGAGVPQNQALATSAESMGRGKVVSWLLMTVGIVGLGTASGFVIKHFVDRANLQPETDLRARETQSSINLEVGIPLAVAGAGLFVTGVILRPEETQSTKLTVVPMPGGAWVRVSQRF